MKQIMQQTDCLITIAPALNKCEQQQQQLVTIQPKTAATSTPGEAAELVQRIAFDGYRLPPPFTGETATNETFYVDILNFGNRFFDSQDGWSLKTTLKRVDNLAAVLREANVKFVCFIDFLRIEEALDKQKQRQEEQIRDGIRAVPINVSGILTECFSRNGIEVRLSTAANNDDTIAYYAHKDGAAILSGDRDFYRYQDKANTGARVEFDLYSDFEVKENRFRVCRQTRPTKRREGIDLLEHAPEYSSGRDTGKFWVEDLLKHKRVIGGVCSPCIRALGNNPFWTVAPLRKYLYQQVFSGQESINVFEQFPVWDEEKQCVVFPSKTVQVFDDSGVDEEMAVLSKNPDAAFAWFFPVESDNYHSLPANGLNNITERNWKRHVHGCKAITIELCCMTHKEMSFVDLMIESETWS